MKKEKSQYQEYLESLSDSDRLSLDEYFSGLFQHIMLSERHQRLMREDFEKAFLYYAGTGTELKTAMTLLDASRLGGFYARPPVTWYPLDDAAMIYPLSMKKHQMAVFRISFYLKEEVVPELLQIALTFTIKRFPSFATTVKKGFFWHYIDSTKRRFKVKPETDIPCLPLNISSSGSQSFRVLYYGKRISAEFFHVLTDGSGGMVFMKTLVADYLRLLGAGIPCNSGVLDINEAPSAEETANDFPKGEPTTKKSGFIDKPAVQMSGRLSAIKPCQILHFELDSTALKDAARKRGASVTAYILSLMFIAHKYSTEGHEGNVQIQVPVNMRKFYESRTVRNFSLYCSIKLPLSKISCVDEILPEIKEQLNRKTSGQAMNEMMNATVGLVRYLRYVPLLIKRPVAGIVYGFLGDRVFSNTLSNLGVVELPKEMDALIDKIDFILGTAVINRASCSMVTFKNTTVLSITKSTADPSFEEKLYSMLSDEGLEPAVKGSRLYGK